MYVYVTFLSVLKRRPSEKCQRPGVGLEGKGKEDAASGLLPFNFVPRLT